MPDQPLAGQTIVVTRSRGQASALSELLRDLGARIIEIPTIAIAPPEDYSPLDAALNRLAEYDWLLVTSANAARVLGERVALLAIAETARPRHVGAVGRTTAEALEEAGFRVDLVPEPFVAESLIAALAHQVDGKRILLARAAVARDVLPDALRRDGARVDVVDAYRTVLPEDSLELLKKTFAPDREQPDGITFTSSSTVTNFLVLLNTATFARPRVAAFSIGPITSATLREHGWEPAAEAAEHDVAGLVAVVLATLSR